MATLTTQRHAKPDYGIDAPGVLRNLLLIGAVCAVAGQVLHSVTVGSVHILFGRSFQFVGALFLAQGLLMALYVKVGKFRHRDRMLSRIAWRGDERVLDIGAGRGLLLIGAAKRLDPSRGGKAIGIDIWNKQDLSGNDPERTEQNIALEGVGDRVELLTEDARRLSFPDASFDVVLSNLCLHNIAERDGRRAACSEIARVLKPGGKAVLSDFRNNGEYAAVLRECGLDVKFSAPLALDTFPPMLILTAEKH